MPSSPYANSDRSSIIPSPVEILYVHGDPLEVVEAPINPEFDNTIVVFDISSDEAPWWKGAADIIALYAVFALQMQDPSKDPSVERLDTKRTLKFITTPRADITISSMDIPTARRIFKTTERKPSSNELQMMFDLAKAKEMHMPAYPSYNMSDLVSRQAEAQEVMLMRR